MKTYDIIKKSIGGNNMINIDSTSINNNVINVDMGECVILDGESQAYLETDGLGPCVGVAIIIKTIDGKVHRLLGHIIMEEEDSYSFEELKACSKMIKNNTKNNIKDIEISFTTSQSYRDRSNLTEDEITLLGIIRKEFNYSLKNIKFYYTKQVQISPEGLISNDFKNNKITH